MSSRGRYHRPMTAIPDFHKFPKELELPSGDTSGVRDHMNGASKGKEGLSGNRELHTHTLRGPHIHTHKGDTHIKKTHTHIEDPHTYLRPHTDTHTHSGDPPYTHIQGTHTHIQGTHSVGTHTHTHTQGLSQTVTMRADG